MIRSKTDLISRAARMIAEQKTLLEERRDEACKELRTSRDGQYRELLDDQREVRLGLRWRQEAGLDSAEFIDALGGKNGGRDGNIGRNTGTAFREASENATQRQDSAVWEPPFRETELSPKRERGGLKSGADIGLGIGFGLLSFLGSLGDGLVPSNPDPAPRRAEPEPEPRASEPPPEDALTRQRAEEEAERWRRQNERSLYRE